MKHLKNPSVRQSKLIQKNGFDPHHWMVVKDTSTELVIAIRPNGGLVVCLEKIRKDD